MPTEDRGAFSLPLPRGVTGFYQTGDPPPPATDARRFRADCYAAARALGGRVLVPPPDKPAYPGNYLAAVLEIGRDGGPVAVLLNVHHPLLAFAEASGPETPPPPRFMDFPALAVYLHGVNFYTILTVAEAERPVTDELCRDLGPAEREQMTYWRPTRVGDVLFNSWD